MEYKYYRELKHNYLVFENACEVTDNDSYQYRIAESGRIKGIIPCSERMINGKSFFYYEIGSMQTLRDRYLSARMGSEELLRLLEAVKDTLENLSEFLLGDEAIVFNIGNIYTDLTTGAFGFIFCPFFDEEKSFSGFTTQLLDIVDDSDELATEIVYGLCEKASEKGGFAYEIISELLKERAGDKVVPEEKSVFPEYVQMKEPDAGDIYTFDEEEDPDEERTFPEKKNSGIRRANVKLGGKIQVMISLLFMGVIAAMMYVRMNFVLSGEENILSIIVMLVCAISGAVAFIGGSRQMKKSKAMGREADEEDDEEEDEDWEEEDTDDFGSFDDGFDMEKNNVIPVAVTRTQPVVSKSCYSQNVYASNETVVLDEEFCGPLSLFSRNLDKTVRIALDKLPVTIGKLPECVDKVVPDMSISRMHCRIVSDGDGIAILDLGSTNGTYRNGVRLLPQEKIRIEEGDEIRIGRVCFDCR